jgi:hypothetical protein
VAVRGFETDDEAANAERTGSNLARMWNIGYKKNMGGVLQIGGDKGSYSGRAEELLSSRSPSVMALRYATVRTRTCTPKCKERWRGWPLATVAFYGPDASRASKVVVGIVHSEHEEACELCDWQLLHGDVRNDPAIAAAMLEFMEKHGVLSVVMSDGLMGCPHQEGIDYEGQWCPDPACAYWHGRDRFTGKMIH